jgi:mannose-1-phosphate guanylyltransferase
MFAVILAGGKGTRFWPFSRIEKPKQFLDITGQGSMLSVTFDRCAAFVPPERIFLFTVAEQVPLVRSELPELSPENIFAEPAGRNTAPTLAVAAAMANHRGGDEPVLCCPADHLIREEEAFEKLVRSAEKMAANSEVLVTFGIAPGYPATGYGYIEAGEPLEKQGDFEFSRVHRFHEKPDRAKAESYIQTGGYYWNSGIFMWRPSVFLEAWSRFIPEGTLPLEMISASFGTDGQKQVIEEYYPQMPSISVDYGILEKADNVVVAPADLGWNDVGSWDALFEILPLDERGNTGTGDMELIDAGGNLFFNPGGITAAIGVEDLIVVVNGGTVLVCRRGQSQRVRELIESLEKAQKTDLL